MGRFVVRISFQWDGESRQEFTVQKIQVSGKGSALMMSVTGAECNTSCIFILRGPVSRAASSFVGVAERNEGEKGKVKE